MIEKIFARPFRHVPPVIFALVCLFVTSLPAQATPNAQESIDAVDTQGYPLSSRHPDAGIWFMYPWGNNTYADLQKPYIKGAMAYVRWNVTYKGPNDFNWYIMDKELDLIINKAGKKAMLNVTTGYCPSTEWPAWMRERVAAKKEQNGMGCHPLQFWDPVYIDLHKAYIRTVATHLAQFDSKDSRPTQTDITFVRANVMAETMENLPNDNTLSKWEWQDFNPAPNGRIHKVNLTKTLKYAYHETIVLAYQQELARAYAAVGLTPPAVSARGGSFWGLYASSSQFAAKGIWFDQHNSSPNPEGWYYDMYNNVKSGATRGTSEAGTKTPDAILAQSMYWEILANLHYGVEFIGVYAKNKFSPTLQPKGPIGYAENRETFEFAAKYVGTYRKPATSPGAWIALRGGYPEDLFGGVMYPKRVWSNYEHLMTQYRPQDSIVLYSNPSGGQTTIMPTVKRLTKQPWGDELAVCKKTLPGQLCDHMPLQLPAQYIRFANSYHEYTYGKNDLGKVNYCGSNMFCTASTGVSRTETNLWARRTNGAGGFPYMRFQINDTFAQSLGGKATIRVVYLDQGNGKWELRYDSTSNAQKSAIVIQKGNTNLWKEVLIDLTDVAFTNRQEGGTDLSLHNMGDDDDTFHMIEVGRFGTVQTTAEELPEVGVPETPPDQTEEEPTPPEDREVEQETPFNFSVHLPGLYANP
jgi:hypothetical protein